MKLLITGSHGQLGTSLSSIVDAAHPGVATAVDRDTLDLTDRSAVEAFLRAGEFTHIVNCAAYTAVDAAEEDKKECAEVNIEAVSNLARIADELDIKILHISTDYVYDGNTCRPYTESDKPAPLNIYGVTKRKGETALLGLAPSSIIIRTGWLYSPYGNNFVKTILRHAAAGSTLRVVCDQVGTPTYAADLAAAIEQIVFAKQWTPGIFNFSNEGVASWYDFAVTILEYSGMADKAAAIVPIATADYPTAAQRPVYTVLDKSKIKATHGLTIAHWHDALRRCLAQMNH